MRRLIGLFVVFMLCTGTVRAYEIRFQDGHSSGGEVIADVYGSVPGQLDVGYFDVDKGEFSLRFQPGPYSGQAAATAAYSDSSFLYVFLTPLPGYRVTLNSFFLGSLGGADRSSRYIVNDDATWGLVEIDSGPVTIGSGGLHVMVGHSSSDELEIGFDSRGAGVGVNYINFDVSPVPEPGQLAMLLAGLAMIGVMARRRTSV